MKPLLLYNITAQRGRERNAKEREGEQGRETKEGRRREGGGGGLERLVKCFFHKTKCSASMAKHK